MAARTTKTTQTDLSAWKGRKEHEVTLPSGFKAKIRLPNLPLMVKTGQLPNDLVQQAIGQAQTGALTAQTIADQADFYGKLVSVTVVDPALTEDDIIGEDSIPFEDIEMIVEFATRQRDLDALGHHLGGLHTSHDWRAFRGLSHLDPPVEGV